MQRIAFLLSIFVFLSLQIKAQKGNDFNLTIPDVKVGDSKYNNLYYLEFRPNPEDMGFIYENVWNGVRPVKLSKSLDDQLQLLMNAVTLSSDDAKNLAVQMRVLFFSIGQEGANKGKGLCNLRMTLYEMDGNENYYYLNTIDTLIVDDKKNIRTSTSSVITSFVISNLPYCAEEDEKSLSIDEVMDIDYYERNSIPLFVEERLPDGLYKNYKSLKNLIPDISSDIHLKRTNNGDIKEIKIPNEENSGKYKKVKTRDVYAFVFDGEVYISFEGDWCKAYKKDGDWRFAFTKTAPGNGFSLGISIGTRGTRGGAGVGFGIPVGGKKEKVEMFIDHLNGDFYQGQRFDYN